MAQHWTDFREYRRGRIPDDWTERWTTGGTSRIEGAAHDLANRNMFRAEEGLATRAAFSWDAPDGDTGIANQQLLMRYRTFDTNGNFGLLPVLRGSGTGTTSHNGYRLVFTAGFWQLNKIVAGVSTNIGASVAFNPVVGQWVWVRMDAQGTTIRVKVWADGDAEPGVWGVTVVDAAHATGWVGFHMPAGSLTSYSDIDYFAVGTNGSDAPNEGSAADSDVLDTWISDLDEPVEITAKVTYYDPDLATTVEEWYSNIGRKTSLTDYPPGVTMKPLLLDIGNLQSGLNADAFFSGAADYQPGSLKFNNERPTLDAAGPLDHWFDKSFYGREVEIRLGRRYSVRPSGSSEGTLSSHRRFELIGCGVPTTEPDMGHGEVTLPLVSPLAGRAPNARRVPQLADKVPVYRNVGILTGIKALSATGILTIPNHASYNVTDYCIYTRVFIPTAGIAGAGVSVLTQRGTGLTAQWYIAVYDASNASANKLVFVVGNSTGGGAGMISVTTTGTYNLGRFVDVILGVKGNDYYYINVDGVHIAGAALAANPYTASGVTPIVNTDTAVNMITFDHRIEKFVPEEEAVARFAARRDADSINISMHRCDDNTGSTVTDYNTTTANHGTLGGVNAVDRSWEPTYLGGPDNIGTAMPFSGGVPFHIPTQPIDSVRDLYRFNDRAKTTGSAVDVLAKGLNTVAFTEPAAGPGVVDLSATDAPITVSQAAAATEDDDVHIPKLVRDELINRGALTSATCDQESFMALRQLLPFRGGFYYGEPPTVEGFLTDLLQPMGSHFLLDASSRVAAGHLLPPVNPNYYEETNGKVLEFIGYPNRGVTFSHNAGFLFSTVVIPHVCVGVCFQYWRRPVDPSATLGTYAPTGQTLVDKLNDAGASGWYIGFDGRNGNLVFSVPGCTTGGAHYHSASTASLIPGNWYLAYCFQAGGASNRRYIVIFDVNETPGVAKVMVSTEVVTVGNPTANTTSPLRIGHGPRGSYYGSIQYVRGWNAADPTLLNDDIGQKSGAPSSSPNPLWTIDLTEGEGDVVTATFPFVPSTTTGRVEGARWCPRMEIDFDHIDEADLESIRKLIPAWRIDSRYRTNYSPLVGANVAAGVTATDRIALGEPYLSAPPLTSEVIRTAYLNSREHVAHSHVTSPDAGKDIGEMFLRRLSLGRVTADVEWNRALYRLRATDEVLLKFSRWGLDSIPVRVASTNLSNLRGSAGLWG